MSNDIVKNQHFIPQFYLRNFACDEEQKNTYKYDLVQPRFFGKSPIKTTFSRNYIYEVRDDEGNIIDVNCREKSLSHQERAFASVLNKVTNRINQDNVTCKHILKPKEHEMLLRMLTSQIFRLPKQIDETEQMVAEKAKASRDKHPKKIPQGFEKDATLQMCVASKRMNNKRLLGKPSKFALYPSILALVLLFRPFAIGYTEKPMLITGDHPFDIVPYDKSKENSLLQYKTGAAIYPLSPHIVFCIFYNTRENKIKHNTLFHLSKDEIQEINSRIASQSRYICSSTVLPIELLNDVKRSDSDFVNARNQNLFDKSIQP